MGLRTPASWIQGGSHTAENDRLTANAEVLAAGTVGTGDFAVAAHGTPNMSVDVAAGAAYVKGSVTSTQGYYKAVSDATVNVVVTAADATNPRIDIVCLTVRDAQYAGANNDVILQVVAGTPAGTPVAPSAPANSYVLAQIAVAANATSITNGNITDKRARTSRAPFLHVADTDTTEAARFRRHSSGSSNPIARFEDENGNSLAYVASAGGVHGAPSYTSGGNVRNVAYDDSHAVTSVATSGTATYTLSTGVSKGAFDPGVVIKGRISGRSTGGDGWAGADFLIVLERESGGASGVVAVVSSVNNGGTYSWGTSSGSWRLSLGTIASDYSTVDVIVTNTSVSTAMQYRTSYDLW